MPQNESIPTYRGILVFWLPLLATWLMMSVEGPFLAAIIARLADPKYNLAAYGVAFSFALIIEAPIIMIMSASTALARSSRAVAAARKQKLDTIAFSYIATPFKPFPKGWRATIATEDGTFYQPFRGVRKDSKTGA